MSIDRFIMGEHSSNNKSNTTIRDVAREANVSISTVSRVLNDHPHVDNDTRQAVWKIVSDLDYPLSRLRGNTSKATRSIAFISNALSSSVVTVDVNVSGIEQLIVHGAQSIFERTRISTYIYKSTVEIDLINDIIETNNISGLVFLGGFYNHNVLKWLQDEGIPFVTAGAHAYPVNATSVMANYIQGMCLAVNHLAETGRTHIVLVNGPSDTNTSDEKYKGLRLALSLNDLSYDEYQMTESDSFDSESGYIATLRLLAQSNPIDAIIYADDGMALGGLKAIRESGRTVPNDIAVIGFHNYEYARFAAPALTTIGFDMQMMGRLAAQRLIALMDGADDDRHVMTVPTNLIIREST
jgi:LacI family transcriptional regulator